MRYENADDTTDFRCGNCGEQYDKDSARTTGSGTLVCPDCNLALKVDA